MGVAVSARERMMRHYLCLALAPALAQGALPVCMMTRSAVAQLVAFTGAAL